MSRTETQTASLRTRSETPYTITAGGTKTQPAGGERLQDAEEETRTLTGYNPDQALNLARLPIPPPRQATTGILEGQPCLSTDFQPASLTGKPRLTFVQAPC